MNAVLPYRCYGQTEIGLIRENNEDALLIDETAGIFCVADGLGGLPDGHLASHSTLENLSKSYNKYRKGIINNERWSSIIEDINSNIYHEGQRLHPGQGMGTTLTLLNLTSKQHYLIHIGDSVAYRLRGHKLEQLTTEHTLGQDILRNNPGTFIPEYLNHTLTRCIGISEEVIPEIIPLEIETNDRLLLCTDGISKSLSENEIRDILKFAPTPKKAIKNLIECANEYGGNDNSSGITLFF